MNLTRDEKVLSYHDVLLRQRDLDSLEPGRWVLDQVFEFYLDFLSREVHVDCKDILYVPPSTTMLLLHQEKELASMVLESLGVDDQTGCIYFALNNHRDVTVPGGSHWSCGVYWVDKNAFVHYDSDRPMNCMFAKSLCLALESALHVGHSIHFIESTSFPQQVNCYDCGLYALAVAALLPYSSEYTLHTYGSTKRQINKETRRALPLCLPESSGGTEGDSSCMEVVACEKMEDMIAHMACTSDRFRSRLVSLILSKSGQ